MACETADEAQSGPTCRFGLHLTLDGYHGDPVRLGDPQVVRTWLDQLPEALGMNKLIEPCLVEVGARRTRRTPAASPGSC